MRGKKRYCSPRCAQVANSLLGAAASAPAKVAEFTCDGCGVVGMRSLHHLRRCEERGSRMYCSQECRKVPADVQRERRLKKQRERFAAKTDEDRARDRAGYRRRVAHGWVRPPHVPEPMAMTSCGRCGQEIERHVARIESAVERGRVLYCDSGCAKEAQRESSHERWVTTDRREYAVAQVGEGFADAYVAMIELNNEIRNNKRGEDNGQP